MKNTKNIIIIVLLIVIVVMAVGYSAFATQLKINGTAQIIGEWNVKITGIKAQFVSEGANAGTPEFTVTSATFDAKLSKPGDKIVYEITIENAGTMDASLQSAKFTPDEENGSPAIKYETTQPAQTLNPGDTTTFTVTVIYDENMEEVPEIKEKTITGIIEYVQK